jgi:hypothetical protein
MLRFISAKTGHLNISVSYVVLATQSSWGGEGPPSNQGAFSDVNLARSINFDHNDLKCYYSQFG